MQQKALIVKAGPEHTYGLDELNVKLSRGWRVVQMTPMGGAGVGPGDDGEAELCLAALVIVERAEEEAAALVEQVEEEIDEIVEGNGAGLDL